MVAVQYHGSIRRAQINYRSHERRQMRDGARIYKYPHTCRVRTHTRRRIRNGRQAFCFDWLWVLHKMWLHCWLWQQSQVSYTLAMQPSGSHPFSRYCCLSLIRRTRRCSQRVMDGPPVHVRAHAPFTCAGILPKSSSTNYFQGVGGN